MSRTTQSKKQGDIFRWTKKLRHQYNTELSKALENREKKRNEKLMEDMEIMKKAVSQNEISMWSPEENEKQFIENFKKQFMARYRTPTSSSTQKISPPKLTKPSNKTIKKSWFPRLPRFSRKSQPLTAVTEQ